jgi:uncharacterized protein (DUF362 family)
MSRDEIRRPLTPDTPADDDAPARVFLSRRKFLACIGGGLGLAAGYKLVVEPQESFLRSEVFVARAESYEAELTGVIRDGLAALGMGPHRVKGKSILLKPNLVEPSHESPHVNTHPAVVRAAVEVFRLWDAREVRVGEGQGHCRDSDFVLEQSGLGRVLDEDGIEYVDLNHDEVYQVPNRRGYMNVDRFWLPTSLRRADLIVSLPKLKTHHWAGVTLSMKNLFGVMPGICYGWPKNVLHFAGIPQSILDINAAVRPHLAIVDGIIGMDGDGPIMGNPRAAGVLVMGMNLPAVDASCARLMGIDPWRVSYLAAASGRLGPIGEPHISQRGEPIVSPSPPFALLDRPGLRELQGSYSKQTAGGDRFRLSRGRPS